MDKETDKERNKKMKYSIDKNNNPFGIQAHYCAARMLMEAFTHNMEIPRDKGGEPMFLKEDLERIGDAYVANVMRIVEITESCAAPVEKDFKVEVSLTKSYKVKCKSKQEAEGKADLLFLEDLPFRNMKTEEV